MDTTRVVSTDCGLKMISGSCYLPRNCDPLKPRGEDSYFICDEEQTIGVADSVEDGDYAGELMTRSVYAIQDEFETKGGVINLRKALNKAFSNTRSKGCSTVCIVTLRGSYIYGISVGDSGFEIFRDNKFDCRSVILRRGVYGTFHLGNSSMSMCDKPNCAQQLKVSVDDGDIVIVGTNGVFANVSTKEIEDILQKETTEAGINPSDLARKIADLAVHNSLHKSIPTTSEAEDCQEDGHDYVRDIIVIVGLIQKAG